MKYIENLVEQLDKEKMPTHVAIIMDGNGRWAKKRGLPRIAGHWAGAEALRNIIKFSAKIGIKVLSVFAFSTENWKRPAQEVKTILNMLLYYLKKEIDELNSRNVKILATGDWKSLPYQIANQVRKSIELTKKNNGLILNIVLNYGSRKEICRACKKLYKDIDLGKVSINEIDESIFSHYLYTRDIPDPDLLIRPSGELRISNFLLWQIAYAELWFTDTFWPDFKPEDLTKALIDYQKRDRRFGGLNKK